MSIIEKKINLIKVSVFVFTFFASFLFAAFSNAASLYFSPSSGSYYKGDTFQISLFVNSSDQAMNAAQATVSFPTDKISVISVSTRNSIFSLMVESPTFSNVNGSAGFSGIVLNPGYTGKSGRLVTINFSAKTLGKATITVGGAQVLANDGVGTNILTGRGSATVNIIEKPKVEPKPEVKPETKPTITPEVITPTTTPTTTIIYVTTTQYIITSTACTAEKLPVIYLKIGGLSTGPSFLLLLLLILSALITIYSFYKGFTYPEKKKRIFGKKK